MGRTGVLLTGFGGPDSIEAVGPFMCNLMGTEPSDELVQRVCRRYLTIGGESPLNGIARDIAAKLGQYLAESGEVLPIEIGMRYWQPYIPDALAKLRAAGCDRVVTVSLSPFESKVAQGAYREAIEEAVSELGGLEIVEAPLVSTLPEFAEFYARSAAVSLTDMESSDGIIIAFTAHSLPESDLVDDDPYVEGLRGVADDVADLLGLGSGSDGVGADSLGGFAAYGNASGDRPWFFVYQSKGNRPGAWLGPDLDELIDVLADSAFRGLLVVPIGFLTDHMETMYDLDVVAAGKALDSEVIFVRAAAANDDENVVAAVAESVRSLA